MACGRGTEGTDTGAGSSAAAAATAGKARPAGWQGAACPTRAWGVAWRWRTLIFQSWSCSSVTLMSAGPSMPLTIKVCAWSSLVPCDADQGHQRR